MTLLDNLLKPVNPLLRAAQTTFALQKAGFVWVRDRTPVAVLLRDTMQDLGATYIKLGQLIASSPSVFPPEFVDAFQSCLDQTKPLPYAVIESVLQEEFGPRLHQLFRHIDPKPLASASIAQVHGATLTTGEDVVIKVQKPGVRRLFETDFQFMQFGARVLEKLAPKSWDSSMRDIVDEIRNGMIEECDFVREADNIAQYQKFLDDFEIRTVVVPKVYRQASTSRVLTMERFYGAPLSDLEAVKKYSDNPEQTLINALNVWFQSLAQCQIYHADLHAGNVMVLTNGKIGFIDFGIVGRISPPVWAALLSLGQFVPAGDFVGIANALIGIGATGQKVDAEKFADDLRQLYKSLVDDDDTNTDPDDFWRDFSLRISQISRKYGIRFPREFTLLVKQFLYFDRYVRLLAPNLDVFDDERIDIAQYAGTTLPG